MIICDNVVIVMNVIVFIKVIDLIKVVYGVVDFFEVICNLIMIMLCFIIGEMEFDVVLLSCDKIKVWLCESIVDEVVDWGLVVKLVEI